MDLYPSIVESPLLVRDDVRRMTQALHEHFRKAYPSSQETAASRASHDLLPFLSRIVADICRGKLPPHPMAHVHLLGIYKERKVYNPGAIFWLWLADQDDRYVDQAVYGAAIELLAFQGSHSLADLEALYADALKRFPGTFAEYHLSPEAIVPDRAHQTTIPDVPTALLQGIMTARLLKRNVTDAYLALDTALRLYPASVPQRFFVLFLRERPLPEAYTVFCLACRSGVVFGPGYLTTLLGSLAKAMFKLNSLADRVDNLRAMANAIYAYLETGGTLEGPHVGSFFNALRDLLPLQPLAADVSENDTKIHNAVVTAAHEMTSRLIQAGMPAYPQAFLSLVKVAARFRVHGLFSVTLQDIETARIEVGDVGRRIILQAAGEFKSKDLVHSSWTKIVERAEKEGSSISSDDWVTFARACKIAGCADYFRSQLETLQHSISVATQKMAVNELQSPEFQSKPFAYDSMEFSAFMTKLEEVKKIVRNITAVVMSGQPLDMRKTPFSMFLNPNKELLGSIEDYRVVYDELTTDPYQPASSAKGKQDLSPTGFPLDELRFQNWVTIVELLNEADEQETLFQQRLDEAIATSTALHAPPSQIDFGGYVRPKLPVVELRGKIRYLRAPRRSDGPITSSNLEQTDIKRPQLSPKTMRIPPKAPTQTVEPPAQRISARPFVSGGKVNFGAKKKVELPQLVTHWTPAPKVTARPLVNPLRPAEFRMTENSSIDGMVKHYIRPIGKNELEKHQVNLMIEDHLARIQENESAAVPPLEEEEHE